MLKLKMFRPFPVDAVRACLKSACKLAVIDRNCSFGIGGIFSQELKAALYNAANRPQIYSFISGLGGRDVTTDIIEEIYWKTKNSDDPGDRSVWVGIKASE